MGMALLIATPVGVALNTISYGQPSSNPLAFIDEEYGMINYPHSEQMSFHIPYQMQQEFQTNFLSMERLWVQVKTFMHGMFDLIINIIETPYPDMSIIFTKMGSLHQMLQWSHIDLHFGFKISLQCNLNVYI